MKAKRKARLATALQKFKELLDRHPGAPAAPPPPPPFLRWLRCLARVEDHLNRMT